MGKQSFPSTHPWPGAGVASKLTVIKTKELETGAVNGTAFLPILEKLNLSDQNISF